MALLFADNFQNWNREQAHMLDGVYAEAYDQIGTVAIGNDPDPAIGSNGDALVTYGSLTSYLRWTNPGGAIATMGVGVRLWMNNLPFGRAQDATPIMFFRNNAGSTIAGWGVDSDGSIYVAGSSITGTGPSIIASSSTPVLTARTFNHIETKITQGGAGASAIEIRVNGVTVINATGLSFSSTSNISSVLLGSVGEVSFYNALPYWKDLVVWDTSGTQNNDFMGSVLVYTLIPDGTVASPWTRSDITQTADNLVDDTDTNPDTTWISADYVTNLALQSETLDNASWTKTGVSVTTNVSNDGDGAATLDRLTEDTNNTEHGVSQSYTYLVAENHVLQADVRDNGAGFARLSMNDGTTDYGVNFNLTDGTTAGITGGATGQAEDLGGGLWRLKVKADIAVAAAGNFKVLALDTHAGSATYTGDGSSGIEVGRVVLAQRNEFTNMYVATTTTAANGTETDPTEFSMTNLPPDIVSVKGLISFARARKSDGGDGNIQVAINSNGSDDLGADHPITPAYAYWYDVSELSPDTGVSYTPLEVDAITLKVDRTL